MQKGFYFLNSETDVRCYYLSGEKKGNKWIALKTLNYSELRNENELANIPNPEWCSLIWTCLPKESELRMCRFSHENPTNMFLKF